METTSSGEKSWSVALVLSIFLGPLGADRFYLGKAATGVLKLITGGGLGIWWLIDVYLIATDKAEDAPGLPLERRGRIAPRIRGLWLVPVCAGPLLIIAVLGGGIFLGVVSVIKNTGAYQVSTDFVSDHELVIAEIGAVTGFGFMPTGSVSTSRPTGAANFSITVKGLKGSGELHILLFKPFGEWEVARADFETSDGRHINLMTPSREVVAMVVRETLLEFDHGVQSKDFTALHASASELFKSQFTPRQLEEAFRNIVENDAFPTGFEDVVPIFDALPRIDENGSLRAVGHLPTQPKSVEFDLRYIIEPGWSTYPGWKLARIKVHLSES